jgi:hypothetical protein
MQQQAMSMQPPPPPPPILSSSNSSFPDVSQSHHASSDTSYQLQQNTSSNTATHDPRMLMSQPSYPHQDYAGFHPQPNPHTAPMPGPNQDISTNSKELIEYHQKLLDYFSQYQSFLSNDMEISKRAIDHLKTNEKSSENESNS